MMADEEKKHIGWKPFAKFGEFSAEFLPAALIVEWILIALWAAYVGKAYLDLNPNMIPAGREFGSAVQTHHLWSQFQECGWCAVWNGFSGGGYPAFADIYGSMLHPVVALTTLFWGVINGAKVAMVIALGMAGLAQWWLASELNLSRIPRLWSAAMVIVGGHLAGRMELGVFGVMFSTAACSLVLAGVVSVARNKHRKSVILLAAVAALALLAGQGYMQLGLLLGIAPAMVFLLFDRTFKISSLWKNYLLALGITLLLASPFLLPFMHFLPNFAKETEPAFKGAQSLAYVPLNLVIDDWDFYLSKALGKSPYPYLYTLYIGWIPVILALMGWMAKKSKDRVILHFILAGILFEFLIGSAVIFKWVLNIFPFVAGIRYSSLMAGLSVPLILALSAYGLEWLLTLDWPDFRLIFAKNINPRQWGISLKWLLLVPLIYSLNSGYQFTKHTIFTIPAGETIPSLLDSLETPSLAWVSPPFGEHFFIEPAVARGFKLSPGIMTFHWKDRNYPLALIEATRLGPPEGQVEHVVTLDEINVYTRQDIAYASVVSGDQYTPCTASGSGGELMVLCDNKLPGRLVVKENMWTGWKAWMDGKRVDLKGERWLEADAPAGEHNYQFRYLPWDVPLGLALFVVGVVLSILVWRREEQRPELQLNQENERAEN
jgi:hypothetical protein